MTIKNELILYFFFQSTSSPLRKKNRTGAKEIECKILNGKNEIKKYDTGYLFLISFPHSIFISTIYIHGILNHKFGINDQFFLTNSFFRVIDKT